MIDNMAEKTLHELEKSFWIFRFFTLLLRRRQPLDVVEGFRVIQALSVSYRLREKAILLLLEFLAASLLLGGRKPTLEIVSFDARFESTMCNANRKLYGERDSLHSLTIDLTEIPVEVMSEN